MPALALTSRANPFPISVAASLWDGKKQQTAVAIMKNG
jgi:hypothetical protein